MAQLLVWQGAATWSKQFHSVWFRTLKFSSIRGWKQLLTASIAVETSKHSFQQFFTPLSTLQSLQGGKTASIAVDSLNLWYTPFVHNFQQLLTTTIAVEKSKHSFQHFFTPLSTISASTSFNCHYHLLTLLLPPSTPLVCIIFSFIYPFGTHHLIIFLLFSTASSSAGWTHTSKD